MKKLKNGKVFVQPCTASAGCTHLHPDAIIPTGDSPHSGIKQEKTQQIESAESFLAGAQGLELQCRNSLPCFSASFHPKHLLFQLFCPVNPRLFPMLFPFRGKQYGNFLPAKTGTDHGKSSVIIYKNTNSLLGVPGMRRIPLRQ